LAKEFEIWPKNSEFTHTKYSLYVTANYKSSPTTTSLSSFGVKESYGSFWLRHWLAFVTTYKCKTYSK